MKIEELPYMLRNRRINPYWLQDQSQYSNDKRSNRKYTKKKKTKNIKGGAIDDMSNNIVYELLKNMNCPDRLSYCRTNRKIMNECNTEPILSNYITPCRIKSNINFINQLNKNLIRAAHNGNIDRVQELLDAGADINYKEKLNKMYIGETALMVAAKNEHLEIVKLLIDRGADLNQKDDGNRTALMLAPGGNMFFQSIEPSETFKTLYMASINKIFTDRARQRLAIMKGYEDQDNVLSFMNPDLLTKIKEKLKDPDLTKRFEAYGIKKENY